MKISTLLENSSALVADAPRQNLLARAFTKTPEVNLDRILVMNAEVWDSDGKCGLGLFIENGKFAKIFSSLSEIESFTKSQGAGVTVIDAEGLHCLPGFIDVHTHLREPGFEYKETISTGTQAAVAGGFTTLVCMANTNPVNDSPYVTKYILSQVERTAVCRVLPVGALSKGLKGEQLAEIGKMHEAGIVAVSDDGIPVMNTYLMRKALDYCKAFGLVVIVHAEDAHLVGQGVMHEGYHSCALGLRGIPGESEEILVARDVSLARLTKAPIHFAHVSSRFSLPHLKRAKEEGLQVTAEVTPHHLMFCDEDVSSYDSHFKMAPPLRGREDVTLMREALRDGVIDCIATDHAPHAPRDKDVLFEYAANGVLGLETAWSVGVSLYNEGVLTLARLIEVFTRGACKTLGKGLKQELGEIKVGAPADFVLVNLKGKRLLHKSNLHSKSANSPFIGKDLPGEIQMTFVDGRCQWINGKKTENA